MKIGCPLAEALTDLDGGGLPGAVRTEERENLPFGDLEADPPDGFDFAVTLPEVFDNDGGAHGWAV